MDRLYAFINTIRKLKEVRENKRRRQEVTPPRNEEPAPAKDVPKKAGLPTAVVDWGKNATDSFSTAGAPGDFMFR